MEICLLLSFEKKTEEMINWFHFFVTEVKLIVPAYGIFDKEQNEISVIFQILTNAK